MDTLDRLLKGEYDGHVMPLFFQHGEDGETLRRMIRAIRSAGIDQVCVESRAHPDFCGPLWWENLDAILDECKKTGMRLWIAAKAAL